MVGEWDLNISKVLLDNYLPYVKGVTINRAIPTIDGLKPVQRRILYTMYKMGLLKGNKTKSSNIVGQTMRLHPHGDMAIYETLVRMTTGNESLNVPYIESKGNFGKVYSRDLAFAAPRYTEAKLADIASELFDGIDENAVDMTNNFDDTMQEPTLLPVKFPSILVNTSSGIAVSTSSSIPSFGLAEVCDATIGMLNGSVTDVSSLMDILGQPEFTTGGFVHASKSDLIDLGKTGKKSFVVSGVVSTYSNRIEIHEIPYRTTAESIIEDIEQNAKDGYLKEVSDVSDDIDLKGFKLTVELKRGSNPKEVLKKLIKLTNIRMSMSFITRVIIDNKVEELGLYELLEKWINFRLNTIRRIYEYRLNKYTQQESLLKTWELIQGNIAEVANLIASKDELDTKKELIKKYGLNDKQVEYLFDMKIRMLNKDNLNKKLKELKEVRDNIKEASDIIANDQYKREIIINDLKRIKEKYGTARKTRIADPIIEVDEPKEEKVDDTLVNVILTKSGYLKRLVALKNIASYELPAGEDVAKRWAVRNNEHILVFTYSGEVYKILVNDIDASKGMLKDKVVNMIHIPDEKQILFIDASGDYSGHLNIIHPNGRGERVRYSKLAGKRSKYKSVFTNGEYGRMWAIKEDEFFIITGNRKAAYYNASLLNTFANVSSFKIARIGADDYIFGVQPAYKVPDITKIDINRYSKGYTVKIAPDKLW